MASNGVSSMEHLQESLEGFIEKLRVVGVIAGDYQLDNPAILKDKVYVALRDQMNKQFQTATCSCLPLYYILVSRSQTAFRKRSTVCMYYLCVYLITGIAH